MKKYLKIGQLALTVMLLIGFSSCELVERIRWHFEEKEQNEKQISNQPVSQENSYEKREPKVDKVFGVEARVYRFVCDVDGSGFLKATNHIVPIKIKVYDDGSMYTEGGMLVRYSRIPGYEYECGPRPSNRNTIYAFNTDEVI